MVIKNNKLNTVSSVANKNNDFFKNKQDILSEDLNLIYLQDNKVEKSLYSSKNKEDDIQTNMFIFSEDKILSDKIEKSVKKPVYGIYCYSIQNEEELLNKLMNVRCHILYFDANKQNIEKYIKYMKTIKNSLLHIGLMISLDVTTFKDEVELQLYESKLLNSDIESVFRRPFSINILIGYMNLTLKILRGYSDQRYVAGALTFIKDKYKIYYFNKEVRLTRTQFQIVYYLFENAGRIVTKEELVNKVQSDDIVSSSKLDKSSRSLNHKSLDVAMCKIREALRDARNEVLNSNLFKSANAPFNMEYAVDIAEAVTTVWARGYAIYHNMDADKYKIVNSNVADLPSLQLNDGIRITYSEADVASANKLLSFSK